MLAAPNQDSYQWLDCGNGFAPIPGQTDSSFAPTIDGSYAVRVMKGNCADTSNCLFITSIAQTERQTPELEVYPNPNTGKATVIWKGGKMGARLYLSTLEGKTVQVLHLNGQGMATLSGLPAGVYVLKAEGLRAKRVMVE